MFYELLTRIVTPEKVFIKTTFRVAKMKQVEQKGVVVSQVVYEYEDTKDVRYNVKDFKIQNILAVGAVDVLKPVVMSDTNTLSVMANLEQRIESSLTPANHE